MDFTNEVLEKMKERKATTKLHSFYYKKYAIELGQPSNGRYYKKSERLDSCLSFWEWDKYEQNKILDLKKVCLCNDNKACPNCRTVSVSKALHKFKPSFAEMINNDYEPYLITLTVPNVLGNELKSTIERMGKSFSRFWEWIYRPVGSKYKGFSKRLFHAMAAVRVLEITVQKDNYNMYHPHFHIMVFIEKDSYCNDDFNKYILGPFRRKSNNNIFFSHADIQIMQMWKMAYDGMTLRSYDGMSDWWGDLYMCDIRPLEMPCGIYEVFKYSFKDTDLHSYKNFIDIITALDGKRLRQCHGELLGLDLEEECGEKIELDEFLEIKENPQQLIVRDINELTTIYHDYRKISRFKASEEVGNIK